LYQENAEIIILQICNKKNLAKFEKCEKYSGEQINSVASEPENDKGDESSEDLSIIEFNSFEIKKRISNVSIICTILHFIIMKIILNRDRKKLQTS
jgi:hypothetical protein